MNKKIRSDKVVVLYPIDFAQSILNRFSNVKDAYVVDEAFFAECHDKNVKSYPLVVLRLIAKENSDSKVFIYYIPETDEAFLLDEPLNFRHLDTRDIGCKVFLKHENECLNGKIAMKENQIVFRFRK